MMGGGGGGVEMEVWFYQIESQCTLTTVKKFKS